jgi:hypothetical protein
MERFIKGVLKSLANEEYVIFPSLYILSPGHLIGFNNTSF